MHGEIVTDDRVQAQMLNDYYGSVFEVEKAEIPDVGLKSSSILASVAITEGIVKEKLKNLKRYSSPGPDGIQNIGGMGRVGTTIDNYLQKIPTNF